MSQSSILLTPDINASVLINQQGENTADFYCHSSVARQIELWTNLSEDKSWIGIPFTRQNETDYSLKVEIINLKPDNYEYTLRFRRGEDDVDWFWYSNIDDNGKIRIVPSSDKTSILLEGHKHFKAITRLHLDNVYLQHFTLYPKSPLSILLEISHNIYSFLVLLRKGSCWVTPVSGYNTFDSRSDHERWQMVMYEDSKDGCVYLWTIASQSSDCWFSPKGGNSISVCHSSERDDDINLLISSTPFKDDFAKLVSTTISYYQQMTNRSNKSVSQSYFKSVLLEKLGYCTWNAFGKEVSLEKIHTAVESLSKHDIPIGYLIIDDGWQAVNSKSQFDSFDACPKKFPGGLKHMVEELKSFYPFLKAVGVWHTLWGYWNGLDEDFANDNGYWWSGFEKKDSSDFIGILSEPSKFYADFYSFLSSSGVDFVKVDNQGAFQDLNADFNAKIQTWDDYRLSMVNNAYRFLKGQIMHLLFKFRNSDDFFPNEKESHTWHIYANIINALWSSQYPVIGDWDMFQSDHPFAEYHASSLF
ncbi:putative galactinol--sucrose galactosyltransferase 2 [Choanephora cucurbitarum]|uniref:Putative galactinol--sucrose galactosyltransferase 2 n=1 Tax=Choanephora cucurbitarum TaxID=101091 RepID=A0A1C7N0B8_9FUNG|nr:putative galactinol--sucrose galactosyltransferase 2 [Choanephora cucurbitarum]